MPTEDPAPLQVGAYDATVDGALARQLNHLSPGLLKAVRELPASELPERLADLLRAELVEVLDRLNRGDHGAQITVDLVNQLIGVLRENGRTCGLETVAIPVQVLDSVHLDPVPPTLPQIGLVQPWLFTAGRREPSLLSELRRELGTTDQADLLISFITRSGVRRLIDDLQKATAVGADGQPRLRMRILTTTYTGATEAEAVEALAALPGCEVRISLDGSRTRLHAKSWVLHRKTGAGTAYIGSANLSGAALISGIEWTVKVPQASQPVLFVRAAAEFECLWADPEFQPFQTGNVEASSALREALRRERGGGSDCDRFSTVVTFDWVPRPFQRLMLERLAHERTAGRTRNLVVAATGTGKTVVAALDYRRSCELNGNSPPTLLFIAHRREILERSLDTFRSVLRPIGVSNFGELLTGHDRPVRLDHLFATIDSVVASELLKTPRRWHTVIIDECHRMGPETRFDDVAGTLQPAILLGLTATPERGDGQSILNHFQLRPDGTSAVELRLWDALDQQLVVPFEYYGCDDETDFREVPWGQGGERAAVAQIIDLAAESRARTVISAWQAKTAHPAKSRTIAFCVTVAHAEYMARTFTAAGIPARCVHGQTSASERADAPALLARGAAAGGVAVLTTVDLYNEGIDIPSVDTLLFLRPTQSPVVFQQQLGRGLRQHEAQGQRKESCLVLDFVGRHRIDFRFDRLLGPVTGLGRIQLVGAVEEGFSSLPPGCHIHLEPRTRAQVLASLREATRQSWRKLTVELSAYAATKGQAAVSFGGFIRDQGLDLDDLYRNRSPSGWTALRRACGMPTGPASADDADLGRRFSALLHIDDPEQLACMIRVAEPTFRYDALNAVDPRRVRMLAYQMDKDQDRGAPGCVDRLAAAPALRTELGELAQVLTEHSDLPNRAIPGFEDVPLCLHAAYERREILAALGRWTDEKRPLSNTGLERDHAGRWEAFFVTLDKSEGFHGRIAYNDCAIAPDQFQWQTQTGTTPTSPVGKRYLEAPGNGWRFLLFVQERKNEPFRALGQLRRCISHQGTKPITLVWELEVPIPQELFLKYCPAR